MVDSVFWRDLTSWATALSENVSLHLNKAHTSVELRDVSYEMRQNLESLTEGAGCLHLLADVYLHFRGKAVEAIAKGEKPRYFHPVPYRRTAYRGDIRMESRSMHGFVQPLSDALREYCHERETARNSGEPSKKGAGASELAVRPRSSDSTEAAKQPDARREALVILQSAMSRGWNVPRLTAEIKKILRRNRVSKPKADRTTIYRILSGETKRPNPAITNALITALKLESSEALIVRRELGEVEPPAPAARRRRQKRDVE